MSGESSSDSSNDEQNESMLESISKPDCNSHETKNISDFATGVRGETQPNFFHDLLAPADKNPSFVVRFDVEIPRPRFVISHRAVVSNYHELTLDDRRELLRVALTFVERMNLYNCSLTIPLGRMKPKRRDDPFFAHLLVPDQQRFLEIYDVLHQQIPQWEDDHRWRSKHWPSRSNLKEKVWQTYRQGLQFFADEGFFEPEVLLAPRVQNFPSLSRRGSRINTSFVCNEERAFENNYRLVIHSSLPLVGLIYVGESVFNGKMPVESRWEVFDAMYEFLNDNCNLRAHGFHMSVTLSNPYRFDSEINVIAIIRFPNRIPEDIIAISKEQNENYRVKEDSNPSHSILKTVGWRQRSFSEAHISVLSGPKSVGKPSDRTACAKQKTVSFDIPEDSKTHKKKDDVDGEGNEKKSGKRSSSKFSFFRKPNKQWSSATNLSVATDDKGGTTSTTRQRAASDTPEVPPELLAGTSAPVVTSPTIQAPTQPKKKSAFRRGSLPSHQWSSCQNQMT